jgi:hypothetical protein
MSLLHSSARVPLVAQLGRECRFLRANLDYRPIPSPEIH